MQQLKTLQSDVCQHHMLCEGSLINRAEQNKIILTLLN